MGEVYRARDSRLSRDVAIKVLPEEFFEDRERRERFAREAKLLASLNHPGIAAIYSFEETPGRHLLVMELVEGEDIAQRLASGPLPLEESLPIARQIAEALEAAHEKGIVHRDLKPANVKVTEEGKVKLLDFGLAKALEGEKDSSKGGSGNGVTQSPTLTAGATAAGVILGTAAYMSPEQARGKAVDKRTDVWAFGCVLYEMLAGRRAFEGETVSDALAAVLTKEPDWAALPERTPASVRRILRRCLQRDARARLHDIADARLELEDGWVELQSGAPGRPTAAAMARGGFPWVVLAASLLFAAFAVVVTWRLARSGSSVPRLEVTNLSRITPPMGRAQGPTWSPDGNLIAYASDRSGDFEIYVRQGSGGQDVDVTNDPGQDVQPAFSPDGKSIAFVSTRASRTGLIKIAGTFSRNSRTYGGDLWVGPALGGAARRIAPEANYPAWRPDGRSILYVTGPENRRSIMEVPAEGGTPRAVLPSEGSSWEIISIGCSPDGRWISFESQLEQVFLMPAAGGKPREVFEGFSPAWDASSRRLWALARDPDGGTRVECFDLDGNGAVVRGSPKVISRVTAYLRELAVSRDGHRLVVAEGETSRNLTRLPLSPDGGAPAGPEEALSTGSVIDSYPQVSPDGRRIAYSSDILGRKEVWILDLQTRRRQRLQLPGDDIAQLMPAWTPDGKQVVALRYVQGGGSSVWIAALDGSRAEELLTGIAVGGFTPRPSPDGRSLLVPGSPIGGVQQVVRYELGTRTAAQLTDGPGDKFDTEWSPDGRWIALTAEKDGVLQLFRMPASGGRMQQLTTGFERMRHPFFSPDGKWIYIQPSHRNICRVRSEGGPLEQVTRFPEAGLFLEEPAISPDGKYLLYCRENGGASLWVLTLAERRRAP